VPDGSQLVSVNELTAVQNYLTTGNYEPFAAQLGQILGSSEASVNSAQLAPLFIAYGNEVKTLAQSLLNQAQNGASQQSLVDYANNFFVDTLSKLGQTTLNSPARLPMHYSGWRHKLPNRRFGISCKPNGNVPKTSCQLGAKSDRFGEGQSR